jgi:histidine ammonia-lyase
MLYEPVKKNELGELFPAAGWNARLELALSERLQMEQSVVVLNEAVRQGRKIYGVTQGFGPLVTYDANANGDEQGLRLISHLAAGQGEPLAPDTTRFMLWLRLNGMKQGYSAVAPDFWLTLANFWNAGFTPVVPRDGSISASGDLVPLAHAALAFAGQGEAWYESHTGWQRLPAREVLHRLGIEPLRWHAREALAFVNGTSASLATACFNHRSLLQLSRVMAALAGRLAALYGANPEHFSTGVSLVRTQPGQLQIAEWIRAELAPGHTWNPERPLQEPYSLRCAPQVIGAVWDQLALQEKVLAREASGCTDNPVIVGDEVLHGGNFHAAPVVLCSDQHALLAHQLAFLAERQLAQILDPHSNGGKPPLLAYNPGPQSGFAGVQIAATSMVAKIRQLAYPASLTALPTNLSNQDHVPMALNGANTVAQLLDYAWLIAGSLALAITQWTYLDGADFGESTLWANLSEAFPALKIDRPLAAEVRGAADLLKNYTHGL